ncbi:uncharacterized protein N7459_004694 [Penicillium hispanicum]|uniref:uncharacterized protein n=1 Tax=Penicillium hispanicum TaxID=1080232 RepID=UPI0025412F75|nr:uncharacterized protein N7459_004694 [Penicillium hispanicum]KAJ5584894.1 hypothetical protein N7459_004694 [Penicillium hispanicum]
MIFSNVFVSSVLAVTAAALPHAQLARDDSSGSGLQIVNNMDATVYLWTTSSNSGDMQTLDSNGGTHSEDWTTNSDGGGISVKLSTSQNEDSVLQFEYTQDGDTLYWDLSSINLNSESDFIKSGFSASPSDSSCVSASCDAGDSNCSAAYQKPDDTDTNSCSTSAKYTLTLG